MKPQRGDRNAIVRRVALWVAVLVVAVLGSWGADSLWRHRALGRETTEAFTEYEARLVDQVTQQTIRVGILSALAVDALEEAASEGLGEVAALAQRLGTLPGAVVMAVDPADGRILAGVSADRSEETSNAALAAPDRARLQQVPPGTAAAYVSAPWDSGAATNASGSPTVVILAAPSAGTPGPAIVIRYDLLRSLDPNPGTEDRVFGVVVGGGLWVGRWRGGEFGVDEVPVGQVVSNYPVEVPASITDGEHRVEDLVVSGERLAMLIDSASSAKLRNVTDGTLRSLGIGEARKLLVAKSRSGLLSFRFTLGAMTVLLAAGVAGATTLPARRRRREREALAAQLADAASAGRVGLWEADWVQQTIRASAEWFALRGLEPVAGPVPLTTIRAHPDDQHLLLQEFERTQGPAPDQGSLALTHRILTRSGEVRWVQVQGTLTYGADGGLLGARGTEVDITELMHARETLEAEQAFTAALIGNEVLPILVVDRDGRLERVNPAAEALLGAPAAELLGRNSLGLLDPDELAQRLGRPMGMVASDFFSAMEVGQWESNTLRYTLVRVDGSRVPTLMNFALLPAGAGRDRTMAVFVTDLSEVERVRREREALAEQLADAVAAGQMGLWDVDLTSGAGLVNAQWFAQRGLEPVDGPVPASLYWSMVHADDREKVRALESAALETGNFAGEYRIVRPSGEVRWISTRGEVRRNAEGTINSVRGTDMDVTELVQAQQALRAEENFTQTLVNTDAMAIVTFGLDGVFTLVNPGAEAILGVPAADLVGRRRTDDFLAADELAAWAAQLAERTGAPVEPTMVGVLQAGLAVGGASRTAEWTIVRGDGSRVPTLCSIAYLRNADGTVRGVSAFIRDISDRKLREAEARAASDELERRVAMRTEQLERAREAAEAANRAKSEFLAAMSHELRTPLNGVLGAADLLHASGLSASQHDLMDVLRSGAEALLTTIGDVLDLQRAETGLLDLQEVPFSIGALVNGVVGLVGPQAARSGLDLRTSVSPAIPEQVLGDPNRVRQILLNLLGNAVRFTDAGSVEVSAEVVVSTTETVMVRFRVADTGIGIAAEDLENIFTPFVQSGDPSDRMRAGSGLGLAIARRLTDAMGGSIRATSVLGQGSVFTVVIPFVPTASTATEVIVAQAQPLAGRVLVVEDSAVNRLIAEAQLARLGLGVRSVDSGEVALGVLADEQFDLALVDVRMPGMDGLELTRRIRAREAEGERIPIIALTANVSPEDRQACAAAGMDDFLPKPLRFEDLAAVLGRYLSSSEERA